MIQTKYITNLVKTYEITMLKYKRKSWYNVHAEIETMESGKSWYFGEDRLYRFFEIWLYLWKIPIWRIRFEAIDLGIYEEYFYKNKKEKNMRWKSTKDITRKEAITAIITASEHSLYDSMSNDELEDLMGELGIGDDPDKPYYGHNFNFIEEE